MQSGCSGTIYSLHLNMLISAGSGLLGHIFFHTKRHSDKSKCWRISMQSDLTLTGWNLNRVWCAHSCSFKVCNLPKQRVYNSDASDERSPTDTLLFFQLKSVMTYFSDFEYVQLFLAGCYHSNITSFFPSIFCSYKTYITRTPTNTASAVFSSKVQCRKQPKVLWMMLFRYCHLMARTSCTDHFSCLDRWNRRLNLIYSIKDTETGNPTCLDSPHHRQNL